MIEKKLKIMEKASEVFARFGIRCLTMDDLARELNISKKTIYTYFKDKDDLINQTLQLKFDQDIMQHHQFKATSINAIDELLHISRSFSETVARIHPDVFTDLEKHHPLAFERMQNHKWAFIGQIIQENLERGFAEGLYRSDIDAEIVARAYVAATATMHNPKTFPADQFEHDDVFFELIRLQINGLASEKGRSYLAEIDPMLHSSKSVGNVVQIHS